MGHFSGMILGTTSMFLLFVMCFTSDMMLGSLLGLHQPQFCRSNRGENPSPSPIGLCEEIAQIQAAELAASKGKISPQIIAVDLLLGPMP